MNTDTPVSGDDRVATPARIELRGGIVALIGEFDLAAAPLLRACLAQFSGRQVVADVSETKFIDSTALGVLAASHRMGTRIAITGATGSVRKVLAITGLDVALHVAVAQSA